MLPHHPGWDLIIAGARRFEDSAPGSYEDQIAKIIAPLGTRAKMLGFIPIAEMRNWQARAAISACPSFWHDPMPKAVLESLAAGCALLTTRRGGIPEAAEGRALIIDSPSIENFADGFDRLLTDEEFRQDLQNTAWQDFPFTDTAMADTADCNPYCSRSVGVSHSRHCVLCLFRLVFSYNITRLIQKVRESTILISILGSRF